MALMNWPRGMGAVIGDDASTTSMLMAAFPSSGACLGGCCRCSGGLPTRWFATFFSGARWAATFCLPLASSSCFNCVNFATISSRLSPFLASNDPACADVEVQAKILKIVAAVCIYSPVGYNHAVAAFEAHAVHTCRPRFQVCWGGA